MDASNNKEYQQKRAACKAKIVCNLTLQSVKLKLAKHGIEYTNKQGGLYIHFKDKEKTEALGFGVI